MGLRYIGSKARVAAEILDVVGEPPDGACRFLDAFCGTGAVAEVAAARGWPVHLNDALASSVTMATARLLGADQVPMVATGGYAATIAALNALTPIEGFFTREYSPLSRTVTGTERRYFTEANTGRIDAIRLRIRELHFSHLINDLEHELLIADLIVAANHVANIAGTYGCFLAEWSSSARRELLLRPRMLPEWGGTVSTTVQDVRALVYRPGDVVYFDPPYTKRQYAAYYHLLETLAAGDAPAVTGVTGLRPWRHLASEFSYKSRALAALERLITDCPARRVLLSYSSEGHVSRHDLEACLSRLGGELRVHDLGRIGRYRPNVVATQRAEVHEYLFELRRPADTLRDAA